MSSSKRVALLTVLLAGSVSRCSCEDPPKFNPGGTYQPGRVLDFGPVSVSSQKTLNIKVISNGGAALTIKSANLPSPDFEAKFIVVVQQNLLDGLPPSQTSSITITYRPCPAAWTNDALDANYDYSKCPAAADTVDLTVVDTEPKGGPVITLSGQPVQAPLIEVACPQGRACNMPNAPLMAPCIALQFGEVNSIDVPCDISAEIRNKLRDGKPTGELNVQDLQILVQEIQDVMILEGKNVGFSVLDEAGMPLDISPGSPLTIPIAEGAQVGVKKVKFRFNGSVTGTFRGEVMKKTGVRIYSDDPTTKPFLTFSLSGTGSAPEIQVLPPSIAFGSVHQGHTKTATLTVTNTGSAPLTVSSINFTKDLTKTKFSWTSSLMGQPPYTVPQFTNNSFKIYVRYAPRTAGQDDDILKIGSNDVNHSVVSVPINGGSTCQIKVTPPDELTFALPNPAPPPPAPPRTEHVRIQNVGYGNCTIQELRIEGQNGNLMDPSVESFSITGCTTNPCPRSDVLCAPAPGCTRSSIDLPVVFQNKHIQTVALASLIIKTTDPTDSNHNLILHAVDRPCFYPSPAIMVETQTARVGMPVAVNASPSSPGGSAAGTARLIGYHWKWFFSPAMTPPAFMPDDHSARVTFVVPDGSDGSYVLGLDVDNDCGASSQTSASETILVSP